MTEIDDQTQELQAKLDEALREVEMLRDQMQQLESAHVQLATRNQEIEELKMEISNLRSVSADAISAKDSSTEGFLRQKLSKLVPAYKQEKKRVKELTEKEKQLSDKVAELTAQLSETDNNGVASTQRKDLENAGEKIACLRNALEELESENRELKAREADFQGKLSSSPTSQLSIVPPRETQLDSTDLLKSRLRVERLEERIALLQAGLKERDTFISLQTKRLQWQTEQTGKVKKELEEQSKNSREDKKTGLFGGMFAKDAAQSGPAANGATWNGREWVYEEEIPPFPPLPPAPEAIELPASPVESPSMFVRALPVSRTESLASIGSIDLGNVSGGLTPPPSRAVSRSSSISSNNRFSARSMQSPAARYLSPFQSTGLPEPDGSAPTLPLPLLPSSIGSYSPNTSPSAVFSPQNNPTPAPTPVSKSFVSRNPSLTLQDVAVKLESMSTMEEETDQEKSNEDVQDSRFTFSNEAMKQQLEEALKKLKEYEDEEANDKAMDDKKLLETLRQLRRKMARLTKQLTSANKRIRQLEAGSVEAATPRTSLSISTSEDTENLKQQLVTLKMEAQATATKLTTELAQVKTKLKNVQSHRDELLENASSAEAAASDRPEVSSEGLSPNSITKSSSDASSNTELESLRNQITSLKEKLATAQAETSELQAAETETTVTEDMSKDPAILARQLQRKLARLNKQLSAANSRVRQLEKELAAVPTSASQASAVPSSTPLKSSMPLAGRPALPQDPDNATTDLRKEHQLLQSKVAGLLKEIEVLRANHTNGQHAASKLEKPSSLETLASSRMDRETVSLQSALVHENKEVFEYS